MINTYVKRHMYPCIYCNELYISETGRRRTPSPRGKKWQGRIETSLQTLKSPQSFQTTYGSLQPFLKSRQFGKPQNTINNKILSSKSALLIPTVSTSAFHLANLFFFSCHHTPTNNVAPLSASKPKHNPQFLQSLWRRVDARNVSFFTLYGGQSTFSTQLLTLNYLLYSPTDAVPQFL